MYLTDKDYEKDDFYKHVIVNRLGGPEFDKKQIQPASIDLRLSNKVWFQKRVLFGRINVCEHGAFDFVASKYWKERTISKKNPLKIRPNETVFGRIHEMIVVPENCVAKIEAKSSIARLSLSVAYSDYCNPKYAGNYPLQIHNSGKNTVILFPYMEICQLLLAKLNNDVLKGYDDASRESIYAKYDDGSPSKWWDTKTNKEMRRQLFADYGSQSIDPLMEKIEKAINASFGDSALIEIYRKQVYKRLKKFLGRKPTISDITFERFFKNETQTRRFFRRTLLKLILSAMPSILALLPAIFTVVAGKFMEIIKECPVFSVIYVFLFIVLIVYGKKKYFKLSDKVDSYLTKKE